MYFILNSILRRGTVINFRWFLMHVIMIIYRVGAIWPDCTYYILYTYLSVYNIVHFYIAIINIFWASYYIMYVVPI